jgi:glycine/D-amino acid oxidase-like deaminating enzyme
VISVTDPHRHVLVVGAGIVGVCTALQLRRAGLEVTLVDRDEPGRGCSFGNAGIIAGDVVAPIAAPGIVTKVPGYLADPEGPLAIRWSYLPALAPWLVRFVWAGRQRVFEQNTRHLASLTAQAQSAFAPLLAEAGAADLIRKTGMLTVFETEQSFANGRRDAAYRRRFGGEAVELGPAEVTALVPALARVAGAVRRPNPHHVVDPLTLTQRLHDLFTRLGGRTLRFTVERIGRAGEQWQVLGQGTTAQADALIVACGAWSTRLLETVSLRLPLDTERGYHVMLPGTRDLLPMPVCSGEGGFFMTPMRHGLRVAGTVEMGGLERAPDPRRVEAMLRRVRRLLPGIDERDKSNWMGFRPSMPDSLPVLGQAPDHPGLFLAFGHGHLGLALSAITGKLLTQLLQGETPSVDLTPFRADRSWS